MTPEKYFRNDNAPKTQRRDREGFPIEENRDMRDNRGYIPPMEKKPDPTQTLKAISNVMKMLGATESLSTNGNEVNASNIELKSTMGNVIREVVQNEKNKAPSGPKKISIPSRHPSHAKQPPQSIPKLVPNREVGGGRTFDIPEDFDPTNPQAFEDSINASSGIDTDLEYEYDETLEEYGETHPQVKAETTKSPKDHQMELDLGGSPDKLMVEVCYHSEKLKEIKEQLKVLNSIDTSLKEIVELLKKEGGSFRKD